MKVHPYQKGIVCYNICYNCNSSDFVSSGFLTVGFQNVLTCCKITSNDN